MGGSASSRRENEDMQNKLFEYTQYLIKCKKELRTCQTECDNLKSRLSKMEEDKARGILKVGENKAKAVGNNANMMTINFNDTKGNNIRIACNKDDKLNNVVERALGSMRQYCTAFKAYDKNLNSKMGETLEGLDFKDGTTITLWCDPIPVNVMYLIRGNNGLSHNNKEHKYTFSVSPLEDIEERVKKHIKLHNLLPYFESPTITYDETYIKVVCMR